MPTPSLELHAPLGLQRSDYSRDLRPAEWVERSICAAKIVNRGCPLWVKSGHDVLKIAMSALLPKARIGGRRLDVRFVP